MRTFYCVQSEFYKDGSVKAGIIERTCKEMPINTGRLFPGLQAFKDWYDSKDAARAALDMAADTGFQRRMAV